MRERKQHEDIGRDAEKPLEIPFKAWKSIGKRILKQIKADHVQIVSAGVAFYFFLAIFPAISAALAIYSLVLDPVKIQEQLSAMGSMLPPETFEIINEVINSSMNQSDQTLGWSLAISLLLSIWSANKGTSALFEGVNIAYNENDERNFIRKTGLTLGFTFGTIVLGLIGVVIVIGFPGFIDRLNLPELWASMIGIIRWLIMAALLIGFMAVIYKVAPHRDNPKLKWVSWGAVISSIFWLGGSMLFSWYVQNFGSYGEAYGSVAAVVILLLWFFLSAFIILLGAEINSEIEHQTAKDTTIGEPRPRGEREAFHADHLPEKGN